MGDATYDLWGPGEHEHRAWNVIWGAFVSAQTPLRFNDPAWMDSLGERWWTAKSETSLRFVRKSEESWVRAVDPERWSATTVVLYAHPAYLPKPRKTAFNCFAGKAG